VLIVRESVVFVLLVHLVEHGIIELSKKEFEVYRHVGVVVQGHHSSLFDEEQDKAVVLIAFNGDAVKVLFEMIRIGFSGSSRDTQGIDVDIVHGLDDALAHRILE